MINKGQGQKDMEKNSSEDVVGRTFEHVQLHAHAHALHPIIISSYHTIDIIPPRVSCLLRGRENGNGNENQNENGCSIAWHGMAYEYGIWSSYVHDEFMSTWHFFYLALPCFVLPCALPCPVNVLFF